MAKIEEYKGARLTIRNDPGRCIHSRYCVLNLPSVFVPNVEGAWIRPDEASVETTIATITKCPSGALTFEFSDGAAGEDPPGVNSVRVWENGPLVFHAELEIDGEKKCMRATLCRCGKSNHKPFCDRMHLKSGFTATGEPQSKAPLETLAKRNGCVKVTPTRNGPLHVEGALEVCATSGRTVERSGEHWFCRCGHSKDKPFCDGSHETAGFTAAGADA